MIDSGAIRAQILVAFDVTEQDIADFDVATGCGVARRAVDAQQEAFLAWAGDVILQAGRGVESLDVRLGGDRHRRLFSPHARELRAGP